MTMTDKRWLVHSVKWVWATGLPATITEELWTG